MADAPGKDNPSDPKQADRVGPVRPPVLEGSARPSRHEDKPTAKPEPSKPPTPPSPPVRKRDEDEGSGAPWLAGILGGVIGLGAAYGLAYLGLWPTVAQAPAQADPRLAQFATAIPELQTVTSTVQDELSTLNGRVAELEATPAPEPAPTEAAAPDLTDELEALSARIDALAEAPAAAADTTAIDALRSEFAALQTALDANSNDIAALQESAAAADTGETARLPLIFSGLESAFASGRPFDAELAALEDAQPDAEVPSAIAGAATAGLPRPDEVARRLDAALPDMLAGRPIAANASWQDATADWFRGVVAMRPAGDVEGTSPDAVIARLEAAVSRRDFVAAQAEFTALPEPMQAAAGTLGSDIAALAEAGTFLADLRSTALDAGAGT